jgi:hypothetical protein
MNWGMFICARMAIISTVIPTPQKIMNRRHKASGDANDDDHTNDFH